jgi:hypothetical protein
MHLVESGRQVGRTAAQIAALPDGSIFLVHSEKHAAYCRGLLRKAGRSPQAIKFGMPDNFERFTGARVSAMDVDHAYWTLAGRRAREAHDFLRLAVSPYA